MISNNGEGLPIAHRMMSQGADVKVYLHSEDLKNSYEGIIDKIGVGKVRRAAEKADAIVFDLSRINEKTPKDRALLRAFGLDGKSRSVFGPIAEKYSKRKNVVGSSQWTEALEFDRAFGSKIAEKVGLKSPGTRHFINIPQAMRYLKASDKMHVLKPDNNGDLDLTYVEKYQGELLDKMAADLPGRLKGGFVLQEKIDGTEVSTEGWFFNGQWVAFNHTIEDKRMMNSDLGMSIGSQANTVWMEPDPFLKEAFDKLSPMLKSAGYSGPVDVNAIVSGDDVYFLEWSPRMGYDAIYNLLTLLETDIKEFITTGRGEFSDGFSCSQRVTIPPFPYEGKDLIKKFALNIPVECDIDEFWALDVYKRGGLRCAGGDGIIGVCAKHGNSIGGAFGNVYRYMRNNLKIGSYMQYRTDSIKKAEKRYRELYEKKETRRYAA